jgi:cytochrome P450
MAALEPLIRRYAVEHIESLLAAGEADVVPALCRPLPTQALAALLHLPDEAGREPRPCSASSRDISAPSWRSAAPHRSIPDEDMISGALTAEIDGAALTDGQVAEIGVQMIAAGFFTIAKALGAAIVRVATVPGLQETLRSRPDLIPRAVEETLRLDLPLHELGRLSATDMELHGRRSAGLPRRAELRRRQP